MIAKHIKPVSLKRLHSALWFTILVLAGMISLAVNATQIMHTAPHTESSTAAHIANFKR